MTTVEMVLVVLASAVAGTIYITPTLLSVARSSAHVRRIVVLNTCVGWTIVGWAYALRLAWRPAPGRAHPRSEWTPWRAGRPEAARPASAAPSTYVDGSYLISASGSARTWAICAEGNWGIAFELDGVQRTASWVDSRDVPVDILAHALLGAPERKR